MKKSKLPIPNYKETPSTRHQSQTISRSRTWKPVLGAFLVLGCCLALPVRAQFSIDWSTIDGGGGTSTNGSYAVSGTIGGHGAVKMSGENYTLDGGFWSVVAARVGTSNRAGRAQSCFTETTLRSSSSV